MIEKERKSIDINIVQINHDSKSWIDYEHDETEESVLLSDAEGVATHGRHASKDVGRPRSPPTHVYWGGKRCSSSTP